MSRHERSFEAAGESSSGDVPSAQREAIACYLSAGAGWDEALKALRGAFATEPAVTPAGSGKAQDKRKINHRTSEYLQWPGLKSVETDND